MAANQSEVIEVITVEDSDTEEEEEEEMEVVDLFGSSSESEEESKMETPQLFDPNNNKIQLVNLPTSVSSSLPQTAIFATKDYYEDHVFRKSARRLKSDYYQTPRFHPIEVLNDLDRYKEVIERLISENENKELVHILHVSVKQTVSFGPQRVAEWFVDIASLYNNKNHKVIVCTGNMDTKFESTKRVICYMFQEARHLNVCPIIYDNFALGAIFAFYQVIFNDFICEENLLGWT